MQFLNWILSFRIVPNQRTPSFLLSSIKDAQYAHIFFSHFWCGWWWSIKFNSQWSSFERRLPNNPLFLHLICWKKSRELNRKTRPIESGVNKSVISVYYQWKQRGVAMTFQSPPIPTKIKFILFLLHSTIVQFTYQRHLTLESVIKLILNLLFLRFYFFLPLKKKDVRHLIG